MGLYGAIIVLLPKYPPTACTSRACTRQNAGSPRRTGGESDFRLAHAAYDHPNTCYDREYLFQFSEMDPQIHRQAEAAGCSRGQLHGRSTGMQSDGADRALSSRRTS